MRLYDVKYNFREAAGGLWIEELTREEDEIKEALARGDAVIIEVAATTEAVTVHSLPVEDLERFGSLSAWSAFECSGRETPFDSMFFRVDVEPVEQSREYLQTGVTPPVNLATGNKKVFGPSPSLEGDDDEAGDLGGGGGPDRVRGREPGDGDGGPAAAPVPGQPRLPRSR